MEPATLWVAAAATGLTALSLTAFGRRLQRHRGWHWWTAALWLAAAGVAATASGAAPLKGPASLLLLQWPVVTLVGLRRFHARVALPLSEGADWAVLAAGAALALFAPLLMPDALRPLAPATATLVVHLYAAAIVLAGPGDREAVPMQWLGLTIAAAALLPLPFAWNGPDVAVPPAARALAAMAGVLVSAFVAATLACERSERQLRDTHRRLRTLANIDTLTNVPNRRHFHELATQALRADRPASATLLMFDIDEFKLINDHFGHAAGDRALCLVSGSLREQLRAHDIAGRHGGDEFAALLRSTRVADAMVIADRIVAALQRQAEAAALPPFSLSFGVVQMMPAETIDDALRRADLALYEAKRQGRSRAVSAEGDEERPVFGESRRLGLLAA